MHCKYATSFTSVNISGLTITSCNAHANTLSNTNFDESQNSPSLFYVRLKNLLIENFYFYDNNFGVATPKFTRSDYFSETGKFSKTEIFRQSNNFSKSSNFPVTSCFSKAKGFSETNELRETGSFSSSNSLLRIIWTEQRSLHNQCFSQNHLNSLKQTFSLCLMILLQNSVGHFISQIQDNFCLL